MTILKCMLWRFILPVHRFDSIRILFYRTRTDQTGQDRTGQDRTGQDRTDVGTYGAPDPNKEYGDDNKQ